MHLGRFGEALITLRLSNKRRRRHRRSHDPMLVLNLAHFNFAEGWDRVFNPLETHERGT
jgi:hypothetical protein